MEKARFLIYIGFLAEPCGYEPRGSGSNENLRDGRDQVKFPPTCGKPTTFSSKCERPLQSVMNFGSAAQAGIDDRQLYGDPIECDQPNR
jgi:hypothetical protein